MRTSSVDHIIIDILSRENTHMSSLEVYEMIRQRLPAINQSTVYRSLERLVNNGKVSVSDMGTNAVVYELVGNGLHHHLVCQNCREVFTIGHEEVEEFFAAIESKNHFQVLTNHLILFGTCEKCQAEAAAAE